MRLTTAEIGRMRRNAAKSRNLCRSERELVRDRRRGRLRLKKRCNPAPSSEELGFQAENLRRDLRLAIPAAVLEERRSTVTRELAARCACRLPTRGARRSGRNADPAANEQREQTALPSGLSGETRRGLVAEREELDQAIAETTATLEESPK